MESWVDLLSGNGDNNDLCFDDFQVETPVEQVAEHCTLPLNQVRRGLEISFPRKTLCW